MIFDCAGVATHLSYCTNIHAGDHWPSVLPQLQSQLPRVREGLQLQGPMGIGLRLSRNSLDVLEQDQALDEFRQWLDDNDHYIFTLNGSAYGAFHGDRIKEDAFKPDWTESARLEYTCRLAELLCRLDPPDGYASINTLPGTFKDWLMPGSEERISHNLIRAVAWCVRLEQKTGVTIALALEPEPCGMLESVTETVAFFRQHLFSASAIETLARLTSLDKASADQAMHRHIGVCYDVGNSSVAFENPAHVIARLQSAGIDIIKMQLSNALDIHNVNEASLRQLTRYDEPVYLHQVVERCGERMTRYNDVAAATVACRHRLESRSMLKPAVQMHSGDHRTASASLQFAPVREPAMHWRVNYPTPVYLSETEHFPTTQAELAQVLQLQRISGFCRHLEVESYTWDVLPEGQRQQPLSESISSELDWVRQRL